MMKQRKATITPAREGKHKQHCGSSKVVNAAPEPELKVLRALRERINSLKLEHAKQLAQDKMKWNSGNPRDAFFIIAAGGLVLKELERQIKETELQVEVLLKGQVETDLHPTAEQKGRDAYVEKLLLDRELNRVETLRLLARKNPDMPHRELCGLFDEYEIAVPPFWKRAGMKTWVEGFDNKFRLNAQSAIGKYRRRSKRQK